MGLGLAAAFLHVALASVRIEGQGPYYDELHQATGAFTWLGEPPPPFFCISAFDQLCVLNSTYSGALKTNLYGLYLRLVEPHFTLASWVHHWIVGTTFVRGRGSRSRESETDTSVGSRLPRR